MLRQCACSAFFATEDGLCEHLDEYRSRERLLHADLKRCQVHLEASGDDDGHPLRDDDDVIETENATRTTKNGTLSGHFCPSCERPEPFKKKQGMRRHFQQHVKCEEVCVCCFKVFRHVRDFIRHAEQHNDAGERKLAYIRNTCNELRELSDKQLGFATRQSLSATDGKKRTWIAAFGSNTSSEDHAGTGRSNIIAMDRTHLQAIDSNDAVRYLDAANIETLGPPVPLIAQSSIAQSQFASMPMVSNNCLDSSSQVNSHALEGQAQGWDVSEDFDAPLLQIMNSVPTWITRWETGYPGAGNPDAEVEPYHGSS